MSGRRPSTRCSGRGRAEPPRIPEPPPVMPQGAAGESSGELRQEMSEMRGAIAGLMRAVEVLTANQMRQDRAPRGEGASQETGTAGPAEPPSVEPEPQPFVQGNSGELLRNFMALQPPTFVGGSDMAAADN